MVILEEQKQSEEQKQFKGEDLRKGNIVFNGSDIKFIIIGDGAFFTNKKLVIPKKSEQAECYIDHNGNIYFASDNKLDSSELPALVFNAYDAYPINEFWRKILNLPIALVFSQEFTQEELVILKSRAKTLNLTFLKTEIGKQGDNPDYAVWTGVEDKQEKLKELCQRLGIELENVLYIDNGLNPGVKSDKEILQYVGQVVCSMLNNEYDSIVDPGKLIKINAIGGEGLIRAFSDQYILPLVEHNKVEEKKDAVPLPEQVEEKQTKALIFDIDGTCTDNMKIYSTDGNQFKKFSLDDIDAIRECIKEGYKISFITGDETKIPENFVNYLCKGTGSSLIVVDAKKYREDCGKTFSKWLTDEFNSLDTEDKGFANRIPLVIGSGSRKAEIVDVVANIFGVGLGEIAYMGDEENEIEIAKKIISAGGKVACPSTSIGLLKQVPGIQVLKNGGGNGNIQEFIAKMKEQDKIVKPEPELESKRNCFCTLL